MSKSTILVWFRRDLRLSDQPALRMAADKSAAVIPVYIHAPEEERPWEPGAASRWWLHHSLVALDKALHRIGSRLFVRRGPTLATLLALVRETGASAVYWNRVYEPALIARDTKIKTALTSQGVEAESFNALLLHEPWEVVRVGGAPYKVFTPFWKASQALPHLAPPTRPPRLRSPARWPKAATLESLELRPRIPWATGLADAWAPGEAAAQGRLRVFAERILSGYPATRDYPGVDGVSRLSPHLHFGEISPRQVWHAVQAAALATGNESRAVTCLRQLAWREFAHHLLYHFPHTPERPFRPGFEHFPWQPRDEHLWGAWTRGRTGIPFVDAGMRELWMTGWMHNRVRMIAASWLTKNARLHWLEGARWFWDTLVDADLANNTLGWQWTAGCGADAAPFFRVFNPVLQGQRYDQNGAYIRRWIPELARLPDEHIHAPWLAPGAVLRESAIELDRDYPLPVLDLRRTREAALTAYRSLR